MKPSIRFLMLGLWLGCFPALVAVASEHAPPAVAPEAPAQATAPQISGPLRGGTADHSKFKSLQKEFSSGVEVTKACLECHTETGKHFMKNIHWTWDYKDPKTGQQLGKRHLVNNFCTNARGNEGMCAQCHAGYGWKDDSFDFTDQTHIDCLVCHDTTGTYYKKTPTEGNKACSVMLEGMPPMDLSAIAQSSGLPARQNCGACHFFGGGGDNVKHGDLSSALNNPTRETDVHMGTDGLNFSCTACHITKDHIWAGSRYHVIAKDSEGTGKPGQRRDVATCESCHGTSPHPQQSVVGIKLNHHVDRVACQTCHIPSFARGGVATKMDWDWRTAGRVDANGEGYKEHDFVQSNGEERATYKSIKGSFKWAENVVPEYDWFDGQMHYTTVDTQFDVDQQPIAINQYEGSADDPNSRIWPFKRMHTWQPFDKGNGTLVYTHLWGDDDSAFWGNYDMGKAIAEGMKEFNLPYSGQFDYLQTVSYWPITHMVAPKEEALHCGECHAKKGRLDKVKGVYLPGRDNNRWLDIIGILAIFGTLAGVLLHGLIRKVSNKGGKHA